MRGLSIIACAATLLGGAAIASAQKTPTPSKTPEAGDECTSTGEGRIECRKILERGFGARMDSAMMKRAALGLQLSPTGTARDTLGVFVSSVTPKGPAENAGIIEGDRIVSVTAGGSAPAGAQQRARRAAACDRDRPAASRRAAASGASPTRGS